jgi:Fic family protein
VHQPIEAFLVPEETEHLCEYVNDKWSNSSALHLAAYVLWRLNWIHPFADGNGRTARTVSYVALSIKLDGLLPGIPTIPDQIASDKTPYYLALEAADSIWKATNKVDVSKLEAMLEGMLAKQLISVANQAAGN